MASSDQVPRAIGLAQVDEKKHTEAAAEWKAVGMWPEQQAEKLAEILENPSPQLVQRQRERLEELAGKKKGQAPDPSSAEPAIESRTVAVVGAKTMLTLEEFLVLQMAVLELPHLQKEIARLEEENQGLKKAAMGYRALAKKFEQDLKHLESGSPAL